MDFSLEIKWDAVTKRHGGGELYKGDKGWFGLQVKLLQKSILCDVRVNLKRKGKMILNEIKKEEFLKSPRITH